MVNDVLVSNEYKNTSGIYQKCFQCEKEFLNVFSKKDAKKDIELVTHVSDVDATKSLEAIATSDMAKKDIDLVANVKDADANKSLEVTAALDDLFNNISYSDSNGQISKKM